MRVVHIVGDDIGSGAGRGAYWLHLGLLEMNVNSKLIMRPNGTPPEIDEGVIPIYSGFLGKVINRTIRMREKLPLLAYPNRRNYIFSTGLFGYQFNEILEAVGCDIVHLHWINRSMLALETLRKLRWPIVWTMRDMWPFTGGCHYSMNCTRFFEECGSCPQLGSSMPNDLSRYVLERKRLAFGNRIHFVAISKWLGQCARKSSLLCNHQIAVIPNIIDITSFFPGDRVEARRRLQIAEGAKVVLAGASNLNGFHKGFATFIRIVPRLLEHGCSIYLFGKGKLRVEREGAGKIQSFGEIKNNAILRDLYASADVFVCPSVQEAFGKVIVEAMACGTPVAAFDTGGASDIVTHKETGWLAPIGDEHALANGILWLMQRKENNRLREMCAKDASERFAARVVVPKYLDIYRQAMGE